MQLIALILNFMLMTTQTHTLTLLTGTIFARYLPLGLGVLGTAVPRLRSHQPIIPVLQFAAQPVVIATALYLLWGACSIAFTPHRFEVLLALLSRFTLLIVPIYIFACAPRKPRDLVWTLNSFLVAAFWGILQAVAFLLGDRLQGLYTPPNESHNAAGDVFAACTIISLAFTLTRPQQNLQALYGTLLLLSSAALMATRSRASILGTIIAVTFVLAACKVRPIINFAITASATIGLIIILASLPTDIVNQVLCGEHGSSVGIRIATINTIEQYLQNHPLQIAGLGIPIYSELTMSKIDPDYYPNMFIQDYIELGVVGVGLSLAIYILGIRLGLQNIAHLKPQTPLLCINACALGILIMNVIHAQLDVFYSQLGDKLLTFAAIGMLVFVKAVILSQTGNNEKNNVDIAE